jgi:hypothetical protein
VDLTIAFRGLGVAGDTVSRRVTTSSRDRSTRCLCRMYNVCHDIIRRHDLLMVSGKLADYLLHFPSSSSPIFSTESFNREERLAVWRKERAATEHKINDSVGPMR